MRTRQGEITVFLSLITVCCLSLFLGLLESARTTGARLYLEMAANSAMSSVMSQYNRNLWDMYHLLFLEAESEDAVKESFETFLSFYIEQENLRFGLEDGHPRTLEEVGKEFNVTRERIRQIEAKALRKLRNPVRSKKIRDFL